MEQEISKNITQEASDKLRLIAFILAFFLGTFGIHRFYVKKTRTGIVMLILTLTLFGVIITSIWAFVDWVMILAGSFKDKEGRIVKKWTND